MSTNAKNCEISTGFMFQLELHIGDVLPSEGESSLVVKVEEKSRNDDVLGDFVGSMDGHGRFPGLRKGGQFSEDDEGDGEEKTDDVHDSVYIGSVHVLGGVTLEGLGNRGSQLSLEGGGSICQ